MAEEKSGRVIGRETVYEKSKKEGGRLRMVEIAFERPSGRPGIWESAERRGSQEAVCIIPLTDDGKLIFVEQFRPPVGKMVIEFPAGLCDVEGESRFKTAQRELEEETGKKAGMLEELFAGSVSAGLTPEYLTVFLARDLKPGRKKDGEEEKNIKTHKILLVNAYKWLNQKERRGVLVDVRLRGFIAYVTDFIRNEKVK